jgi:hypothetical protein
MGLIAMLVMPPGSRAEGSNDAPAFAEVYDLIKTHLTGMSDTELNRIAVQSLVSSLGPKVSLGTNGAAVDESKALVSKTGVFEDDIAYVRIERVGDGLAKALRQAYDKLSGTNSLKGLVLDLRYAGGGDYAAAANVADLFIHKEQPLLNWGQGMVNSKEKSDAVTVPVAVLVNRQTSGAAEALAGVLRQTGTGLVLGSRTAGRAMIAKDFPLKDGQVLRVATAAVQLGNGTALSGDGIKPDIAVEVSSQDEKAYFGDAYKDIPRGSLLAGANTAGTNAVHGTNQTARRARFNEAELVRERKEGISGGGSDSEAAEGSPEAESGVPVVQDPALARALDVLKGLAVVRQAHS